MRPALLLALAAVAGLVAAPAPASAAKKVPRTCDRLTGPIVLKTTRILIVKRNVRDIPKRVPRGTTKGGFVGRRFYGCALPGGRVRELGSSGTTYFYERGRRGRVRRAGVQGTSRMAFSQPAGTYVLSRNEDSIAGGPSAGTYQSGLVQNLETGKRYPYWDSDASTNPNAEFVGEPPARVILSEEGRLAAIFDDDINAVRSVRGFSATGSQKVLDTVPFERRGDIPLDTLALEGTTVSWTNAGERKSAELAEARAFTAARAKAPATCDKLTGRTVLETPQFKIVSRRVREVPRRVRRGVTKGGFIGRAFYGCTLPAGKVRRVGQTGTNYLYERGRRGRARRAGSSGTERTTFSDAAGTFVLVRVDSGIEGGPSAGNYNSGSVENLATGEDYVYWAYENSAEPGELVTDAPTRAILDEQGVLAAIFDDPLTGERTVRGFAATGKQTVLDTVPGDRKQDIPPESLALDGTTVSWTNAGQPKSGPVAP